MCIESIRCSLHIEDNKRPAYKDTYLSSVVKVMFCLNIVKQLKNSYSNIQILKLFLLLTMYMETVMLAVPRNTRVQSHTTNGPLEKKTIDTVVRACTSRGVQDFRAAILVYNSCCIENEMLTTTVPSH